MKLKIRILSASFLSLTAFQQSQALDLGNAGPVKAVKSGATQIWVGAKDLKESLGGELKASRGALVVYFEKSKNEFRAVAAGPSAQRLYAALMNTTFSGLETGIGIRKSSEVGVIVISGEAVNRAVKLVTGLGVESLSNLKYAGEVALTLDESSNKFVKALTGQIQTSSVHVLSGAYEIVGDALNTAKAILTLEKPIQSTGKFLWYLPGKVLDIARLGILKD